MSTTLRARAFALVAVVALVGSVAAATAAPADEGPTAEFDPGVPDEYDFSPTSEPGVATVDGERFDSLAAALDATDPGETVVLRGRFDERVTVDTPGVTLRSAPGVLATIDGGGEGDVLTVDAPNVTVERVWVRDSGFAASTNDAGVWVNGTNATIRDARVTAVTFGIWVNGVDGAAIRNTTIVGRESVTPRSERGNGIQLWRLDGATVVGNRITDARDGIYYSWASNVVARGNTLWDLRYGVHYMYSDDNRLVNNTAFGNDVGYALMLSKRLEVRGNVAYDNTGESGHGILLKAIDDTTVANNELVGNDRGVYLYNSLDNRVTGNLLLENEVGVRVAAGSTRATVRNNSFIGNDRHVRAVVAGLLEWNGTERGNYWSGARTVDRDGDGVGELRYRPVGVVEGLIARNPAARVFLASPAFDAVRTAERSVPLVESTGIVDRRPLVEPTHEDWRRYYERDRTR
jgi:nitrous oxidase accessory protein